jgi:hypothetical protein
MHAPALQHSENGAMNKISGQGGEQYDDCHAKQAPPFLKVENEIF